MKTKILLIILYLATLAGYVVAQTPGFNYQAVLRNPAGETMTDADVTLHFSLIDDPTENVIYKESQTLTTDELGILTCMIGAGTVESGTFSEITGKQDVTLKIEAEFPGTTGMTSVGESKLGIIPYALYGKDEDADPDNEMQSLAVEGDSVRISGRGGVELNQLNYWQKTDSSYVLSLDPLNNNKRELPGAIQATIRDKEARLGMGDNSDNWGIYTPRGFQFKAGGQTIQEDKFGVDLQNEISGELFSKLNITAGSVGSIKKSPWSIEGRYANTDFSEVGNFCLYQDWRSQLSISSEGSRLTSSFQDHDLFDFFIDLVLGGVGADLYKIGVDEFGCGFGVFCFDDIPKSERSQAATFGGTFSTANDNGLTTLSGAVPGIDPTNGNLIIFNGTNLGTRSTVNSESAGTSSTYGSNGQLNTTSGTFAGESTGGAHMTFDAGGELGAYMWTKGDGTSQMGADQFIMSTAAPGRSNEMANYAAPVGGESATYDRGTAKLVNGEATVVCPESFRWIADEASMTVTITPLSADSKGIAVIEKTTKGFKVKELHHGAGNYEFDYLVMCKRKGQEEYEVVRPKPQLMVDHSRDLKMKIPKGPLKSIRDLYQK